MVGDTSGIAIIEELKKKFGVNIKGAEKKNKVSNILFLSDQLGKGLLKICTNNHLNDIDKLIKELSSTQWKDPKKYILDTSVATDGTHLDLSDALLYGFNALRHRYVAPEPIKTKDGLIKSNMSDYWNRKIAEGKAQEDEKTRRRGKQPQW